MTNGDMLRTVREQLAIDLNCTVNDLSGEKDALHFVPYRDLPGRRPFPHNAHHAQIMTMGEGIVVSATDRLLEVLERELTGKDRDDVFAAPIVNGHSLYYLPDMAAWQPLTAPEGYDYALYEHADMPSLYVHQGFSHALFYDPHHLRPDVIAMAAYQGETVVAIAGASLDCQCMWQIGIDTLPSARGKGLAAYLTDRLTREILRRGIIPYYGTASSNIASQRTAHRAGYRPAWMCAYRFRIDGYDLMPSS